MTNHSAAQAPGAAGIGVSAVSVAFIVAGIMLPEAADTLLRLFPLALAAVYVAVRAAAAVLAVEPAHARYSPFEGDDAARASPALAAPLRALAGELRAADDAAQSERQAIPATVRRIVVAEATCRLAARRGLSLADPAHHAAIRARVSEPTWRLIAPHAAAFAAAAQTPGRVEPVPLASLALILDDVERL